MCIVVCCLPSAAVVLSVPAAVRQERTEQRYFAARAARGGSAPNAGDHAAPSLLWRLRDALLPRAEPSAGARRRTSGVQTELPAAAAAAALGQSRAGEAGSEGGAASGAAGECQAREPGEDGEVGVGPAAAPHDPEERAGGVAPLELGKDRDEDEEDEQEEEEGEEEELGDGLTGQAEEQDGGGRCADVHAMMPCVHQGCLCPVIDIPYCTMACCSFSKHCDPDGSKQGWWRKLCGPGPPTQHPYEGT